MPRIHAETFTDPATGKKLDWVEAVSGDTARVSLVVKEEPDQWPEGVEVECDHCGSRRICIRSGDPFVAEIYPGSPNPESFWCRPCYRKSNDET